jgi:hypothetical protein
MIFIENVNESEQCHPILIASINLDDNVIVFRTTMNVLQQQ